MSNPEIDAVIAGRPHFIPRCLTPEEVRADAARIIARLTTNQPEAK